MTHAFQSAAVSPSPGTPPTRPPGGRDRGSGSVVSTRATPATSPVRPDPHLGRLCSGHRPPLFYRPLHSTRRPTLPAQQHRHPDQPHPSLVWRPVLAHVSRRAYTYGRNLVLGQPMVGREVEAVMRKTLRESHVNWKETFHGLRPTAPLRQARSRRMVEVRKVLIIMFHEDGPFQRSSRPGRPQSRWVVGLANLRDETSYE